MSEKDFKDMTSLSEKPRRFKKSDNKTVKNRVFLKHGSYSFLITVVTLAVIVLINFVVSTLADKVQLEYDMTSKKTNSLSSENKEYLENLAEEVTVTVCGKRSDYTAYLMNYGTELYNVNCDEKLLNLTLNLIDKYGAANDNITVKYVDMQSIDFTEISQKYSSEKFSLGDILVTSPRGDNSRFRHLLFRDIYQIADTSGYAIYGYSYYTMEGSRLESALTSAINFVLNKEVKKALIYKGHSTQDYSAAYKTLLESNNYVVDTSNEPFLSSIDSKYDSVVILAPSTDFMKNETQALATFLDNGGDYGKGIIFVAEALNPELPTLYEFLAEWGIEVYDGMLLETNKNALPNTSTPTALLSFPTKSVSYTKETDAYITGYNVPMKKGEPQIENVISASAVSTLNTTVKAPAGVTGEWNDYTGDDLQGYDTVIEAKLSVNDKNSYVFALSSVEFISSTWAETPSVANKDIVLAVTDRASGKSDNNLTFIEKSVTKEGYTNEITEIDVKRMRRFLLAIPVIIFVCGIVVFIMRRNAK